MALKCTSRIEGLTGMITMDTIGKVRRAFFVQKKPIRAITREYRLARNTVRDIVRAKQQPDATERRYDRREQPMPQLGAHVAALERLLEENAAKPKRERLTFLRLYEGLREGGYTGGYDAVRRYARGWERRAGERTAQAFVPLVFAPGEAYQFDWSHEIVVIAGAATKARVAQVRPCHSRMLFVRAYRVRARRWCSTRTRRRSPSSRARAGAASTTT